MKKLLFCLILIFKTPLSYANQEYIGSFSTVSESECNTEITLKENMSGIISETCRREDGSHIDDVEYDNISWTSQENNIIINYGNFTESYKFHFNQPCSNFGSTGLSKGLTGSDAYFFKLPIKCK